MDMEGKNTIQLGQRVVDLMSHEIYMNDVKLAELYNRIALFDPTSGRKYVDIEVLLPSVDPADDPLDFDPEKIREMIMQGYEDAKAGWRRS